LCWAKIGHLNGVIACFGCIFHTEIICLSLIVPAETEKEHAYAQLGHSAEAAQAYREALRRDPPYYQAVANLAALLESEKRDSEALEELAPQINAHVSDCFERIGKFSALRYELMDRTGIARSEGAGGEVVAEDSVQPVGPRWLPQASGSTARFRGVSAVSASVAWACGSNGTFARTVDEWYAGLRQLITDATSGQPGAGWPPAGRGAGDEPVGTGLAGDDRESTTRTARTIGPTLTGAGAEAMP
jgi:hypothetical protein